MTAQPFDGPAGEQAVGRRDGCLGDAVVGQAVEQLDDGAARGDLVIEHDGPLALDVADDGVDDDGVVAEPALGPGSDGQPEQPRELGGVLGVAEVGGDDDGVVEVLLAEVVGEHPECGEVVHRHGEEAVHLRGVQVHREHAVGTRGRDQVSHEPASERDARGVLLVAAGIGVVGDHRGDHARGGALGGIDHEQQLHERVLRRGHEGLDDVDVALAAVRQQLGLEAVVAEPAERRLRQLHPEFVADAVGQGLVGRPGEDDDLAHVRSLVLSPLPTGRFAPRLRAPTGAVAPPPVPPPASTRSRGEP